MATVARIGGARRPLSQWPSQARSSLPNTKTPESGHSVGTEDRPQWQPTVILLEEPKVRKPPKSIALFALGFRPFFLAAGVFAVAFMAVWLTPPSFGRSPIQRCLSWVWGALANRWFWDLSVGTTQVVPILCHFPVLGPKCPARDLYSDCGHTICEIPCAINDAAMSGRTMW
jgi:hypothetical protein